MTQFNRTPAKTSRARILRQHSTPPEQKLWFHLPGARMNGFSFRRQHPVGPYILDFYCPTAKMAIELDGDRHGTARALVFDAARSKFLGTKGIIVLRFWNHEIRDDLDRMLDCISRALTPTRPAKPGDLPLSGGGHQTHK